jgi:exopolysaccharide production protein ExoZ
LSGFLMVHLHRDMFGHPGAWHQFFGRRITRIVPLYWTLTTVALVLFLVAPELFALHKGFDWGYVLGCYLFIPIPMKDGLASPILGAGWTLEFEMCFYALFTVALLWRKGLAILFGVLAISTIFGFAFQFSRPWEDLVTSPMLLEFALGCTVALATPKFGAKVPGAPLLMALSIGLLVAGAFAYVAIPPNQTQFVASPLTRVWAFGAPCALLVASVVWLNPRCEGRTGRTFVMVGDASYSIYLFQVLSLPAIAIVLRMIHLPSVLPVDLAIAVLWFLSCASGIGCWRYIERPLTRRIKSALHPIRSLPAVA